MGFWDVFAKLLEENKLNPSLFSTNTGIPKTTIYQWRDGSLPSFEYFIKIADYFKVSLDELADRQRLDTEQGETRVNKVIPIVGYVTAGELSRMDEAALGEIEVPADKVGNSECYALKVNGYSMMPNFLNGDIVVVKKQLIAENGNVVIVSTDNETTMKKWHQDDSSIILTPLNPAYDPVVVFSKKKAKEKGIAVRGKVLFSQREF